MVEFTMYLPTAHEGLNFCKEREDAKSASICELTRLMAERKKLNDKIDKLLKKLG